MEIVFKEENNNNNIILFPKTKIDAESSLTSGNYRIDGNKKGKIVMIFDNSYSYFTAKQVKYQLRISKV